MVLAGCGLADSRSPVPEFMRNKAPESPPAEAPPEVARLVRENLDSLFSAAQPLVTIPQPIRTQRLCQRASRRPPAPNHHLVTPRSMKAA